MFFFCTCINNNSDKAQTENPGSAFNTYAGSASCAGCHKEIYQSHINTAHFHTSEMASRNAIKGSFDPGHNTFTYHSGAYVKMLQEKDSLYQVAFVKGNERLRQHFDIVTGSGTKGQTYLTFVGNNLYQLPISYFTSADAWCNSPGMPDKIVFYRPITSRCLECHATYAEKTSPEKQEPELFDKSRMILGVDCEKCHGPAAQHVAFQSQHPTVTTAQYIVNPANFTRQQSLHLCSLCHGGRMQKTKPSFGFTAGKNLADYFTFNNTFKDASDIDVHGNQYGLLAASKCFQNSKTMTCITCHDSHKNEQGEVATFSQRCISCHNEKHADTKLCKMTATLGSGIDQYCSSCHMPELPSSAIAVLLEGKDTLTPAKMHTHLIKNYPEETKRILALINKGSNNKSKKVQLLSNNQ